MFARIVYFIITLVVTGQLLRLDSVLGLSIPVLLVTLIAIDKRLGKFMPAWIATSLPAGVLGLILLICCLLANLGLGPTLVSISILLFMVAAGGETRKSVHGFIATILPLIFMVQLSVGLVDEDFLAVPVEALIWSLCAWPFIAVLSHGTIWRVTAYFGMITMAVLIHALIRSHNESWTSLLAVHEVPWRTENLLLAVAQVVMVALSTTSALMGSSRAWRWCCMLGMLFIAGPLIILSLTGPWDSGWPWWVLTMTWVASVAAIAGVIGMMCTVRHNDLMVDTAVRTIAFGVGASAVNLLQMLEHDALGRSVSIAVMEACAPLLVALVLNSLLEIAAFVVPKAEAVPQSNRKFSLIPESEDRLTQLLGKTMEHLASQTLVQVRARLFRLNTAHHLIALIMIASAYPAWLLLAEQWWLPFLMWVSVALEWLRKLQVIAWVVAQAVLLMVVGYVYQLSIPGLLALGGLSSGVSWFFIRWPHLNGSWAFIAGLFIFTALWHVLHDEGGSVMNLMLLLAITTLVGNAFCAGRARSYLFIAVVCYFFIYFATWVLRHDRFASITLEDVVLMDELLLTLGRLPLILVILIGINMSRWSELNPVKSAPHYFHIVVTGLVGLCAVIWGWGYRPGIWEGCAFWLLVAGLWPSLAREYTHGKSLPITGSVDALAWVTVSLLLAATQSLQLLDQGTIGPGTLATIFLQALRDFFLLFLAFILVLLSLNRYFFEHWGQEVKAGTQRWLRKKRRKVAAPIVEAGQDGISTPS